MPQTFDPIRGDLSFQADFSKPEFGLYRDLPRLNAAAFEILNVYGLGANDIVHDFAGGNFGKANTQYYLPNRATLGLYFDRFTVTVPDITTAESHLADIVGHAFTLVGGAVSAIAYKTFQLRLNLHGPLLGTTSAEFLLRFLATPPGVELPPLSGCGFALYALPTETQLSSTITLDVSAAIADGLYVNYVTICDATKVLPTNVWPFLVGVFKRALSEVGIVRKE